MQNLILLKTDEFTEWFELHSLKDQKLISVRISRIIDYGHYGDCKNIGDNILELRWKNGRRIYFNQPKVNIILLLIGGSKNGQKKDIKKARLLAQRYTSR